MVESTTRWDETSSGHPADAGSGATVAFAFTGQGSQHPGMTAGLYQSSDTYRYFLDEVAAALLPSLRISVVDLILDGAPRIHQSAFAQPALFAVEYALARTLAEAGIRPVAVLGHGVGEYAAAVTAGALRMADAASLVAARGALMQGLPEGGMVATAASPEVAAQCAATEPQVWIAAVNGPRATVLSGDLAALERVTTLLDRGYGIRSVRLNVSRAFQSVLMEPARARLAAAAQALPDRAVRVPYYSTVRGRMTTEPLGAGYWSEQAVAPVRFADAARELIVAHGPAHLVEIGPRRVLTPLLRRIAGVRGPKCHGACAGPETGRLDLAALLLSLGAGRDAAALASVGRAA